MIVPGDITAIPARQYLAATAVQAGGLGAPVRPNAGGATPENARDSQAVVRAGAKPSPTQQVSAATNAQTFAAIKPASARSLFNALISDGQKEKSAAPQSSQNRLSASPDLASQDTSPTSVARRPDDLSEEEKAVVDQLKARDREVRAHEQAHKAVGGRYAGAISYTYQKGPDGQRYAVGGEVPIDASPEAEPDETIAKMRVVIAAALAPAEPSAADRAVAQLAQSQLIDATAEARKQARDERQAQLEAGLEDDGRNRLAEERRRQPERAPSQSDRGNNGPRLIDRDASDNSDKFNQ